MSTKLRCLLLDDELPGLTYLKMLCQQIPDIEVIRAFNNPVVFLKEISKLDFDFCILDIEMPEMNGLQIADLITGKPIIFATAYKEYAAEAFDLNAVDYIRKPIKLERLKQTVEKVRKQLDTPDAGARKSFVQLNTNIGKTILFFDTIAYIRTSENDSRDKVALLFGGEELVLKNITFDQLLLLLPKSDFCRINKKEILSLKAVQVFSFDEITTGLTGDSGENLKLSLNERYRKDFLRKVKA